MPIPSGFGQVSYIFGGQAAGPQGSMVTLGLDHAFDESPDTLVQELYDAFESTVLGELSSSLDLVEARLRQAGPGGEVVTSYFQTEPGRNGAPASPANVAVPVRKLSAFAGRANRGRWFLPGMPETLVTGSGAIDAIYIDDMNTALVGFMSALAAADFTPVVLHTDSELAPTVILAMFCGNLVYTRGSRLR